MKKLFFAILMAFVTISCSNNIQKYYDIETGKTYRAIDEHKLYKWHEEETFILRKFTNNTMKYQECRIVGLYLGDMPLDLHFVSEYTGNDLSVTYHLVKKSRIR